MSRPTTRSKNKRHRQEENVDTTSEILRKIHTTGDITDDDIAQLYKTWKPVCQGCRVNTKDNPNCFCGLIPPPNGSRKAGLWQKMTDILQALGPDPTKDLRASNTPAGLTNLGATCYANSILQCLYMNKSFREGIFSLEPDVLRQNPVLDQLSRLFAQLHTSRMAFIDSSPFVKTLELDNGVQQDSHEFLTLLLSLLERCLSHSKVSTARTIVQDLFRGRVSHVTTMFLFSLDIRIIVSWHPLFSDFTGKDERKCSRCGKDSQASSNMEDFYELELNVKGLKNLNESLDDYLSVEELQGDNQYFCESCKTRVDATRSIKLRSLPAVLNFQLKRCVFLPKTTMKKKITSAFCFPGELDMQLRLSEHSQFELVYDLSAVLIHKGTAVNSGHYVAHIKDEDTGQWWEVDDEHVSNLGRHPFGEGSSSSTSKSVESESLHPSCTEPKNGLANGNHIDAVQPQSSESSDNGHAGIFSSGDAYMLMYNLRHNWKDSEKKHKLSGPSDMEVEADIISFYGGVSLPSHLCEEIKNLNASYDDACQQYELKKERELDRIMTRRQEVRSVLSEAPVRSIQEPFFWISMEWLRQWADNVTPPVLDNSTIQCLHGKVPLSKVSSMKRLSAKAWDMIHSKHGGGPALSNYDYCMDCLVDGARTLVCGDSYRDRRTVMKQIANEVVQGNCEDGAYYVSKAWLQQWLKRKILDAPSEADAGPTVSIKCPHGQLMPDQATGAKRVLVPENLWLFLYEDAVSVKPDDPLGCATFPSDARECSHCSDELSEVAVMEDSLRVVKLKQRLNHEKLAMGKSIPLLPHCKNYLVPSSWLLKWKDYINASGKNVSASVKPETLDGVIESLKCEKHMQLLERPPELVCKRGTIVQKTDGLTIITENDWKCFCEEWGGTEEKGIYAIIEYSYNAGNTLVASCEEMPVFEERLSSHDEETSESESRQPVIRTCPEICEECIGERESCELMQKLNYCNEDIHVFFARDKEAPKSFLEASDTSFEQDRRVSKRSRKTTNGNLINLKVSGSTSVYQLKMMIWESFGVVKENQILHKGARIIDKESATLADMNIFPGDKLWVIDSEIHEHRDIAGN
ncbi:Ubiquitin carboxyl-terminal hydrolase 26 [Morella rubra]|uniref:ubiquitinyl hydrolase 1 n=1 Tax=Morella rubra TaxID=262757 RepID=A0A6A1UXI2_9ROSI|nr:Ubiquitin carboxyl-terminal hydrolase 26 [Morella rubra]